MSERVPIRRLPTGVPGLDAVLGGGVPEFSFNVIAGAPGAGKTTLVQQIMFALARSDRRALFFTVLGEPPLKMLRYQQQFEFFDLAKVNAVTVEEVNRVANKYLTPDKMAIVIVGDRSAIEPRLREIEVWGKSITYLDAEGNPIKIE